VPPSEAAPKARAAILKALALDENAFEAHRVLAGIMTWTDWDWTAAERAWNKVLALQPNEADALSTHSHYLMHMGRQDEAMKEIERAVELDPFNPKILSFQAQDLLYVRRYDEAIAAARAAQKLQPDAPVARTALLGALFMGGLLDEALAVEKRHFGGDPELMSAMERGRSEAGYPGAKKRLADVLAARFGKPGGVTSYHLANLYLHAGDRANALDWLERAYGAHDPNMPYLGQPQFDSVRADPRFRDLLRRVGLPQ
jgi:tetratricopeptide (TPR) repeat protein